MALAATALAATLAAVHADGDTEAIDLGDGQYMDWSTTRADGKHVFEVSDGDDTAQLALSRDQVLALHTKLTLFLIQDAQ